MMATPGASAERPGSSASASATLPKVQESPPGPGYMPKFSAATEMILKRLRGEGGPLAPGAALHLGTAVSNGGSELPGYENVRRSVLETMKTSVNMEMSPSADVSTPLAAKRNAYAASTNHSTSASGTPAAGNGVKKSSISTSSAALKNKSGSRTGKAKAGTKRKRVREGSESDQGDGSISSLGDSSSDEAMIMPTQTLSGRKINKPATFTPPAHDGPPRKRNSAQHSKKTGKNIDNALCKRCSRGHSPATNMIVFCDGCNMGWHQMCHDPSIPDTIVKDENSPWFCKDCAVKKAAKASKSAPPASISTSTPKPVVPGAVATGETGGWATMTAEQKRTHFSSMPAQHLIGWAVHATTLHPNLPIPTAANTFQTQSQQQAQQAATWRRVHIYPQPPFPPNAAAGLFTRADANPVAPMNFIRKVQGFELGSSPASVIGSSRTLNPPQPALQATYPFTTDPINSNGMSPLSHTGSAPPAQVQPVSRSEPPNTGEEGDSRESTPASPPYPRPGNGLMARLKPDAEDLEWLAEAREDEGGVSHLLFDDRGGVTEVIGQ